MLSVSRALNALNQIGIRGEDRRDTFIAFLTLFSAIAGHAVLETARDSLFLASLPITRLPWAYLAIAGITLLTARLNEGAIRRLQRRRILSLTLLVAALVTVGGYFLLERSVQTAPFVLYVWTGLVATTVIVQFWLLMGDVLDVSRAKRLFSIIAAGGLLGAACGSALSGAVLHVGQPRDLLLLGASFFAASALLPLGFQRSYKRLEARTEHELRQSASQSVPQSAKPELDGYARRLVLIGVVSAAALTLSDYLFKAVVAREVASTDLGQFFAAFYAALNLLALVIQVLAAPYLLRVFGVGRSLFLLPGLLFASAVGFAFAPLLLGAAVLKSVDGSLRHSVHRSATEILFLPLKTRLRERLRGLVGSLADRGGQALASIVILVCISIDAPLHVMALGLVALSLAWLASLFGIRMDYANRFRHRLRGGSLDTRGAMPPLDLHSLEALLRALSATDDAEVHAALDMFGAYNKRDLVSPLILYHPSADVVLHALEMFRGEERPEVQEIVLRLMTHPEARVRAAAILAPTSHDVPEAKLLEAIQDESDEVQVTALSRLAEKGRLGRHAVMSRLTDLFNSGFDGRLALARLCDRLPPSHFGDLLTSLVSQDERLVASECGRALCRDPKPEHIPLLLPLLRFRESRRHVRPALVALGDAAFNALALAHQDKSVSPAVRLHIPRTLSRFKTARALQFLVTQLRVETDQRQFYKILRAVGRMRADDSELSVDRDAIVEVTEATLRRAYQSLRHRVRVEDLGPEWSGRARGHLTKLLSEIEETSVELVFRLLHVLEPSHEYELIHEGLHSDVAETRAASRELLEHVVSGPMRDAIVALTSDLPARDRLEAVRPALRLETVEDGDANLFEQLVADAHRAVRSLTAVLLDAHSEGSELDEALLVKARREHARVTLPMGAGANHAA